MRPHGLQQEHHDQKGINADLRVPVSVTILCPSVGPGLEVCLEEDDHCVWDQDTRGIVPAGDGDMRGAATQ